MLISTEHEISIAHKNLNAEIKTFLAFKLSTVVFIILLNVKNAYNCCHFNIYEHDKLHAQ